jgi:TolB-like protein/DNA-binding winged helix-turn-helix (wHTH) protein/Flp pilus assembly protein TadD
MQEFLSSVRLIRFGVFEVDLRAEELRRKGLRVRLQSQPFQLLVTLLKQRGELVTREELRRTLWPEDTFVDFDHSLGTAINKLREALGDSATNPRFVETVPRKGYRFLAPVDPVEGAEAAPEPTVPAPAASAQRIPVWMLMGVAAVLVSVGVLAWVLQHRQTAAPVRSLAVLPLENLSGDGAQDYFSDGMTDELITELGQFPELRVISRTSVMTYKGAHKPLPQIARELNVDAVVEGTVLRSGNSVRITAQLIPAATDKQLWSASFEVELRDILAVQRKVAKSIAGQIRVKLNPNIHDHAKSVDTEAYEAYLKGRYFWNRRTTEGLQKAVEYFHQAIAKDPKYAQAYSGLADSYALMGDWEYGLLPPGEAFPKAKAAATKAFSLDNSLGEAHTSLAFVLDLYDWDWEAAERQYRLAIDFTPSYATAHQWYAWHLIVLGRNEEAIAEMSKAQSLDPLSLIIGADMADLYLVARRYDESIRQSRSVLELDSRFAVAHYLLGQALVQKGLNHPGIAELRSAIDLSGGNVTFRSALAYAYAISGQPAAAVAIRNELQKSGVSNPAGMALIEVGLKRNDEAMNWLEKAYQERFNPSVLMRPGFDPLRSDARFVNLLGRIGLGKRAADGR